MPLMTFASPPPSIPLPCFLLIFPLTLVLSKDLIASEFHHGALLCSHCPCCLQTHTHICTHALRSTCKHMCKLTIRTWHPQQQLSGKENHKKTEFHYVQRPKKSSRWKESQEERLGSVTQVRHMEHMTHVQIHHCDILL